MLLAVFVCLAAFAPSANARIGNPIKKAKEKLQKATGQLVEGQTPEGDDVVFDNVTVELTDERVAKIVSTFQRYQAENAARQELTDRYDQKRQEQYEFANKNEEASGKLRAKRAEVEACYHESYQKITERKARELAENPMDPARLARNAKLAQENNAAAAKGDSAAIARMQNALNADFIPSKEESVEVRRTCGTPPPKSAAEKKLEQLDQEIASQWEQIRAFDERIAKAQAKEGLLTQQQWSVALERVHLYAGATSSQDSGGGGRKKKGEKSEKTEAEGSDAKVVYVKGFSKAELVVLAKHRAELREALK
jgi:hypothetical protein